MFSAGAGVLLSLWGLQRRGWLGAGLIGLGLVMLRRSYTGRCPMYQALGMDSTRDEPEPEEFLERGIHVEETFTINKPAEQLFSFWRNMANFPSFMVHLQSVEQVDDKRSHWQAKGPVGFDVQWDAEIVEEEPGTLIAWRSVGQSKIHHAGSIHFLQTADRGTEVKVVMDYLSPAGKAGQWLARLFGKEPGRQVREDMRRFKQKMETGEIPSNQDQPRGRCATKGLRTPK